MYTCNYCGEGTALNYDACRGCAHYPCFCGQNVPVLVMCADYRDKNTVTQHFIARDYQ